MGKAVLYGEDEITCPYCKTVLTNDSWEYSDEGEEICEECGKKFTYQRNTQVDYSSYGDCKLNNEEHDWVLSKGDQAYFCNKCNGIKLVETTKI